MPTCLTVRASHCQTFRVAAIAHDLLKSFVRIVHVAWRCFSFRVPPMIAPVVRSFAALMFVVAMTSFDHPRAFHRWCLDVLVRPVSVKAFAFLGKPE